MTISSEQGGNRGSLQRAGSELQYQNPAAQIAAAHGYFESYRDWSGLTKASPFASAGRRTPVFARVGGQAELAAVKFYADEGDWDFEEGGQPLYILTGDGEASAGRVSLTNDAGASVDGRFVWTALDRCGAPLGHAALWQGIEAGCYPEWELGLQLDGRETLVIGRLVLDRNPDTAHAAIDDVAFDASAHGIPGVDFAAGFHAAR
jgi:catalase